MPVYDKLPGVGYRANQLAHHIQGISRSRIVVFQVYGKHEQIIEQMFSGQLERLEKRCLDIGGMPANANGCDLSFRFRALPRIPVIFHFNDKDDTLPAQSAFLFNDNADKYLDIKSLGQLPLI